MLEQLQLDRRLQLALDALPFTTTTAVQDLVIPAALAGKDLVVSAETGSGKTLAYLVPLVQRLLAPPESPRAEGPRALVLVPTRELARQVLKQCRALLAKTPLQVYGVTGGADFRYQQSLFRKNPEIIVATPAACWSTASARAPGWIACSCWCWMRRIACWIWGSATTY